MLNKITPSQPAELIAVTAQFFAEKLNVPVEYFNPFRSVQIDPGVNLEELSKVAHSLGEVVGLGIRNMANCPVELNLMPESTLRWQSFNQKKPYFIATLASLALMALAVGFLFNKLASVKEEKLTDLNPRLEELRRKDQNFKQEYGKLRRVLDNSNQYSEGLADRAQWAEILREVREALIRTEAITKLEFGTDTGVWVEKVTSFSSIGSGDSSAFAAAPGVPAAPAMNPEMDAAMRRYMDAGRVPGRVVCTARAEAMPNDSL